MPNFELTGEDAYKFFCMLSDEELDKFIALAEADEQEDTEQE